MTVPTLYNFTEALQAPDLAFSTLRDCHPRRTATGGVALSRTSRFAEAEIEWQSRKYLLCFPLSTASIFAVEQTAARLRYLRTPLLTEYTILRDEMTYTDDTGTTRTCDVVLHRLPEGRPLSVCAAEFDAESLRSALDKLEAGLSELGFSHNNLKPGNLYVTSDGRLIPVRYHFARFGEGHDAEGFERLRQFVREQGGKGQMLCDAEPSRYTTLPETADRILATSLSATWTWQAEPADYRCPKFRAICSWARCPINWFVWKTKPATGSSIPKTDRLSRRNSSGPPTSAKDAPKSRPHRAWA